ncbi:F-box protein CPR1 [Linum perenne]
MSDHIPIEIVTGILLRLPVFSLVRFRCVSKQWRSIIDSPAFTKQQIHHSTSTTRNATLFILQANGDLLYQNSLNGFRRETFIDFRGTINAINAAPANDITLFGSCNGLLCLSYDTDQALIYNVATKKSHFTAPLLPEDYQCIERSVLSGTWNYETGYGFGYDSVSDDYKVVRVFHFTDLDNNYLKSQVIHFGVRSNSCKIVEISYVLHQKMGAFLGGAIHWIATSFNDLATPRTILGFDLGLCECKEIPQPDYAKGGGLNLRVAVLGNCLSIFDYCKGKFVDVWMMKEYGVKDSWMKLFSVPYPVLCYEVFDGPRGSCIKGGDGIRALGFSMNGGEVLLQLDGRGLVWYDINKGCADEVTICGLNSGFMDAIVCYGSLVSPDGKLPPAEVKAVKQQKKKKQRDDFLSSGFKLKL